MTKLEQLIQELCPNGVEYKEIDDLSKTIAPKIKIKSKDYLEKGVNPIIDQGQNYIGGYTNNSSVFPKDQYIVFGDHTCVVKYVDFPFLQGADGVKVLQPISDKILLTKYLYYCMCNIKMAVNYSRHWSKMRKSTIPVPPLEVQAEIVRILDKFTELTTELTTELANRKKQFEYYRDKLLSYEHSDCFEELGKVAKVTKLAGFEFTNYVQYSDTGEVIALRGLNVKDGRLILDDVKYIDNSNLSKLDRSKLIVGDMLFTYVGTVGQVALIDENDKYYLAPNVAMIRIEDERLLPKYLMYYFQSSYFKEKQINRLLQSSSMKNIPMEKIRKFIVPIPSIQTQESIISVLDNFEAICSDLNSGLPAEIEARQKQYEYYREKLLTFKEVNKQIAK